MAAYLAAGPGAPTSTENETIANEAQFVEATGALARGLVQFDLSMGGPRLDVLCHAVLRCAVLRCAALCCDSAARRGWRGGALAGRATKQNSVSLVQP